MLKIKKKYISLLLSLTMVSSYAVPVSAVDTNNSDDYIFLGVESGLRVYEYNGVTFYVNPNDISYSAELENTSNSVVSKEEASAVKTALGNFQSADEILVSYTDGTTEVIKVNGGDYAAAVNSVNKDKEVSIIEPNYEFTLENNTTDNLDEISSMVIDNAAVLNESSANEIVIAVIGTGLDINHPAIKNYIYTNPNETIDGIDNDKNGFVDDINGWDFANRDNTIYHGINEDLSSTLTAGKIVKTIEENREIFGDKTIKILPIKISDSSMQADMNKFASAIDYAKSQGASIVNTSMISKSFSKVVLDKITNSSMLFISEAGDVKGDLDLSQTGYPAYYNSPNIIAVGASDSKDEKYTTSDYGKISVDVFANGEAESLPRGTYGEAGAMVANNTENFKTLYHGFGYEMIEEGMRAGLMENALNFFKADKDSSILLVADDGTEDGYSSIKDIYTAVFEELGYKVDVITQGKYNTQIESKKLNNYDLVVWATGYNSSYITMATVNQYEQNAIMEYLDFGGNVYMVGRNASMNNENSTLFRKYFNTVVTGEENLRKTAKGIAGKGFEDVNLSFIESDNIDMVRPNTASGYLGLMFPAEEYDTAYTDATGTKVAAGEVTALAAMLKGVYGLNTFKTKAAIMQNVRTSDPLKEISVTGGVVDIQKTMENALTADESITIPGKEYASGLTQEVVDAAGKDYQVYRMYLKKNQIFGAYMSPEYQYGQPIEFDLDLYLYGPNASDFSQEDKIVAKSVSSNVTYESINNYRAQEDGYYYIVVKAAKGKAKYSISAYSYTSGDVVEVKSNDGFIGYYGAWKNKGTTYNSYKELNSDGKFSFTFTGSNISLYSMKGPAYGKGTVVIDGVAMTDINLFKKEESAYPSSELVFSKELDYGEHTIELYWLGQADPDGKSTATAINIASLKYSTKDTGVRKPTVSLTSTDMIDTILFEVKHNYSKNIKRYELYRLDDSTGQYKMVYGLDANASADTFTLGDYFNDINPEKKEYSYKLVAFDAFGTASEPTYAKATPNVTNVRYTIEDDNPHIQYIGEWEVVPTADGTGTVHATSDPNAMLILPFTGYGFKVFEDYSNFSQGTNSYDVYVEKPEEDYIEGFTRENNSSVSKYKYLLTYPVTGASLKLEPISGVIAFDKIEIFDYDAGVAPKAPTNPKAHRVEGGVQLSWTDSTDLDVVGFEIYRSTSKSTGYTKINDQLVTDMNYFDATAEAGKEYYYKIRSVDMLGLKSYFTTEFVITAPEEELNANVKPQQGLNKLIGDTRYKTAVEVSNTGWPQGANNVILVNGAAIVDGITAGPLAAAKDAPILLTSKDALNTETKAEIERLKAKTVYVIGGEAVISPAVEKELKAMGIKVQRIGGQNRYETSLMIAQYVDEVNEVTEVYVANGYSEADVMSIAARASATKSPIILTPKDELNSKVYTWLKSEELENAYVIGGNSVVSGNVLDELDRITSKDILDNRIAGANRHETNVEVIKTFYGKNIESVFVTKSNNLVDALTAAPLAAKFNGAIFITNGNLTESQIALLKNKKSTSIYQIGGGEYEKAMDTILNLLAE